MDNLDEEESLRSNRNRYPGAAYGPMKRTGKMPLRLDFNMKLETKLGESSVLKGFNLRIMEDPEHVQYPEKRAEFGVYLTVEQWQDLISAMQAELDLARDARKRFEDI